MIHIGIDPGVNTGYAEWDTDAKRLACVESMRIDEAMTLVLQLHHAGTLGKVVFEDARLRTGYFGPNSRAKQQGAGSVKRDCTIWEQFCKGWGIAFQAISPAAKGAKLDAARFERVTGWSERTNEHGRDAAMLVFGS